MAGLLKCKPCRKQFLSLPAPSKFPLKWLLASCLGAGEVAAPDANENCGHAFDAFCSRKNRIISLDASGPLGSAYDPC